MTGRNVWWVSNILRTRDKLIGFRDKLILEPAEKGQPLYNGQDSPMQQYVGYRLFKLSWHWAIVLYTNVLYTGISHAPSTLVSFLVWYFAIMSFKGIKHFNKCCRMVYTSTSPVPNLKLFKFLHVPTQCEQDIGLCSCTLWSSISPNWIVRSQWCKYGTRSLLDIRW